MTLQTELQRGYELLFERVRLVSEDCTEDLERVRREGLRDPMSREEVRLLLGRCMDEACQGARHRGDLSTATYLESIKERTVQEVMSIREASASGDLGGVPGPVRRLALKSRNGVAPHPVVPSPVFHGRPIPVHEGFVDVGDIRLWGDNKRLNIHVEQFKKTHGRDPTPADLVDIMNSRANLPGLEASDQFKIEDLARSIAANGVRTPPVVSFQGILLDGNRRVTACLSVLASDDFTPEQKEKAKIVRVWQLTEHATPDDEDAVVVSLNFEPDYKEDWPEYVKGRILYEEWRAVLENEVRPSAARQATLKRTLADRFALRTERLNRYIQMVELTDEFEEHARENRGRDAHEVQHRANEYFQYFDELGKGRSSGGVNWSLNQDDTFKELVFDLLYDKKFRNFSAIRDLRHVYQNDEATELLREANRTADVRVAREQVDNGLAAGRTARAVERQVGGNKRVEAFVKWLREAPLQFFSPGTPGAITERNLSALYDALKIVEVHVPEAMRSDPAEGPPANS